MGVDPLLLLPLAAFTLVVLYPVFDRKANSQIPRSISSRARRRILLARLTVIVLLIATAAAVIWPVWPQPLFGRLLQALLLCAVVLLPAYLAHAVMSLKRNGTIDGSVLAPDTWEAKGTIRRHRKENGSKGGGASSRVAARVATSSNRFAVEDVNVLEAESGTPEDENEREPVARKQARETPWLGRDAANVDDEVNGQPARFASLVDSLDIVEGSDLPARVREPEPSDFREPDPNETDQSESKQGAEDSSSRQRSLDAQVRPDYAETTNDTEEETESLRSTLRELHPMSASDIARLVDSLKVEKLRLQKLVIAQQAAYKTRREAHRRTRAIARKAVQFAKQARESQSNAEKLARRERRKRTHVELQYQQLAKVLNNAVSMIEVPSDSSPQPPDGADRL